MIDVWKIQKALFAAFGSNAICVVNAQIFGLEADFAYITKAGYWYEVEIKRSYADFLNDFKKTQGYPVQTKHDAIAQGQGRQNYFTFCFDSKALAEKCLPEVPAVYGVMFASETVTKVYDDGATVDYNMGRWAYFTRVEFLRPPQRLHTNKMDWKHVAFRVAQSYKTKVFFRLKWPDAPAPIPAWLRPKSTM